MYKKDTDEKNNCKGKVHFLFFNLFQIGVEKRIWETLQDKEGLPPQLLAFARNEPLRYMLNQYLHYIPKGAFQIFQQVHINPNNPVMMVSLLQSRLLA